MLVIPSHKIPVMIDNSQVISNERSKTVFLISTRESYKITRYVYHTFNQDHHFMLRYSTSVSVEIYVILTSFR